MKLYLHPLERLITSFKATGALAQLVEQRTENPCVPGSIPGGTTFKNPYEAYKQLITGFICIIGCLKGCCVEN